MSILVRDTGFAPIDRNAPAANSPAQGTALALAPDTDLTTLSATLDQFDLIAIDFPSFADGRGFTLARGLRLAGYRGRLRARGHVLADQYAMARRAGFDEVEIDDALARRQPESHWLARANWQAHDYQSRLRG